MFFCHEMYLFKYTLAHTSKELLRRFFVSFIVFSAVLAPKRGYYTFVWWLIGVKVLEPFGQRLKRNASQQLSFRSLSVSVSVPCSQMFAIKHFTVVQDQICTRTKKPKKTAHMFPFWLCLLMESNVMWFAFAGKVHK